MQLSDSFFELLQTNLNKKFAAKKVDTILSIFKDTLSTYTKGKPIDISDDDFLKQFLTAKQVEGRSSKTINRYNYVITNMLTTLNMRTDTITVYHLREYFVQRKEKNISDKTLEGERSIFSSYFGWLHKEGLLPSNPCANLGAIKCQKKIKLPFTDVELMKLREHCESARDKALINFLLCSGCRVSEIIALNRNDIDFDHLEVTVLGKGNKERSVYMDEVCAMHIKEYLQSRTDNSEALFVGKGSSRLTAGGIRYILHSIGKAAGVDNVHPHRFRRTLATNLINRGMSIQEVAEILGHENINTTMTYVYLDKVNVKNSYKKYY